MCVNDVGQKMGQFNPKKLKIKKRRKVKKNDWKIGNSRSMRLLASGVFKKLWFWTFLVVRFKSHFSFCSGMYVFSFYYFN